MYIWCEMVLKQPLLKPNAKIMKNSLLTIGMLCLFSIVSNAQDFIDYARNLKSQYPDEEVVISKSTVVIEFDYKSKYGITATKESTNEFVTLKKNVEFIYPVFYTDDVIISDYKTGPNSRVGKDDYYNSNGIFHDDVKVKYSYFKIPLFGGVSDVKAELFYTDVKYLTNIYFNSRYTILDKEVQFIIPSYIDVDLIPMNFEGYDIKVSETMSKKGKIIKYQVKKVEGFSDESNLPGRSYLYPHIFIHLKSYTKDGEKTQILESTADQYNWYARLVSHIGNDTKELEVFVDELIADDNTDEEKIESIFYWVQENIRYIAFEDGIAGFKPASCQKVFSNRYGDCKGMANLTKEMMIAAGFDARLAWLGTRRIAYDYSIPSLAVDNHMICALILGNEIIYLDATEKYSKLGEYAERIQNQHILIQNGDSYLLETIPASSHEQNLQKFKLDLLLQEDMTIDGRISVLLSSEVRTEFMNIMSSIPSKDWEKAIKYYLSSGNDLVTVSDISMPEISREEKYEFSGNISYSDKISTFDNEAYVYIDPFMFFDGYKLDDERKFGLWFDYKKNVEISINFEIPETWEISSIPDNLIVENDEFIFNVSYEQSNNSILYIMTGKIPDAKISSENLDLWNETISKLNQTYEQPIILRKR